MSILDELLDKLKKLQKKDIKSPSKTSNDDEIDEAAEEKKRQKIERQRKLIDSKTINRYENMPQFEQIISGEFGDYPLDDDAREDYVILLASKSNKAVDIIRSIESYTSKGVDNKFLEIRQDLTEKDYKYRASYFASRSFIKLIYDKISDSSRIDSGVENATALSKDFEKMLEQSVQEGVSDIHIEVRRDIANVRMRINGMLKHRYEWPVQYARDMAVVIYQILAAEKDVVFLPNQPQDAIIDRVIPSGRIRVRLATVPCYPDGFDVVMRLLPIGVTTDIKKLSELGYLEKQVDEIERMTDKPVGAIIISGVTGSGKSTSMATMLATKIRDHEGKIKVITVENPPENKIEGASQVPIVLSRDAKNGKSPFAATIKAAMRNDPDVLMIGETRDEDSADLLVHATQSGHTTVTTLHAPSAFSIPSRLRSLGVANDVLGSADFFSGLVYQTLVQTVCPHCHHTVEEAEKLDLSPKKMSVLSRIKKIFSSEDLKKIAIRNEEGCKHCSNGISGRTVVAEVVFPDNTMKKFFSETKDNEAKFYFLKNGGKTVLHAGIEKLLEGRVDPADLEHKVGRLDEIIEYRKIAEE